MRPVTDLMWKALVDTYEALVGWLAGLSIDPTAWSGFTWLIIAGLALLLLALFLRPRRPWQERRPELLISHGEVVLRDREAYRAVTLAASAPAHAPFELRMTVSNLGATPIQLLELSVLTNGAQAPNSAEVGAVVPPHGAVDVAAEVHEMAGDEGRIDLFVYVPSMRPKTFRLRARLRWEPWNARFRLVPLEQRIDKARGLASSARYRREAAAWRRGLAKERAAMGTVEGGVGGSAADAGRRSEPTWAEAPSFVPSQETARPRADHAPTDSVIGSSSAQRPEVAPATRVAASGARATDLRFDRARSGSVPLEVASSLGVPGEDAPRAGVPLEGARPDRTRPVGAPQQSAPLEDAPLDGAPLEGARPTPRPSARSRSPLVPEVHRRSAAARQQGDPMGTRPRDVELAGSNPVRPEPGRTERSREGPMRTAPIRIEPGRIEPGRIEPGRIEPGRSEPGRSEPGPSDPAYGELAPREPAYSEPTPSEMPARPASEGRTGAQLGPWHPGESRDSGASRDGNEPPLAGLSAVTKRLLRARRAHGGDGAADDHVSGSSPVAEQADSPAPMPSDSPAPMPSDSPAPMPSDSPATMPIGSATEVRSSRTEAKALFVEPTAWPTGPSVWPPEHEREPVEAEPSPAVTKVSPVPPTASPAAPKPMPAGRVSIEAGAKRAPTQAKPSPAGPTLRPELPLPPPPPGSTSASSSAAASPGPTGAEREPAEADAVRPRLEFPEDFD